MINIVKLFKKHHKTLLIASACILLLWLINNNTNLEGFDIEEINNLAREHDKDFDEHMTKMEEDDYDDEEENDEEEEEEEDQDENYRNFKDSFLNKEERDKRPIREKVSQEAMRVAGRLKDKTIESYNEMCEYYNI